MVTAGAKDQGGPPSTAKVAEVLIPTIWAHDCTKSTGRERGSKEEARSASESRASRVSADDAGGVNGGSGMAAKMRESAMSAKICTAHALRAARGAP